MNFFLTLLILFTLFDQHFWNDIFVLLSDYLNTNNNSAKEKTQLKSDANIYSENKVRFDLYWVEVEEFVSLDFFNFNFSQTSSKQWEEDKFKFSTTTDKIKTSSFTLYKITKNPKEIYKRSYKPNIHQKI